jgi:hypothetical protein
MWRHLVPQTMNQRLEGRKPCCKEQAGWWTESPALLLVMAQCKTSGQDLSLRCLGTLFFASGLFVRDHLCDQRKLMGFSGSRSPEASLLKPSLLKSCNVRKVHDVYVVSVLNTRKINFGHLPRITTFSCPSNATASPIFNCGTCHFSEF